MDQPVVEQPMEHVPPADAPSHTGQKNTIMAVLSYVGPLVIVSYLMAKDDPFVKFHIRQGAVLFAIEIAISLVSSIFMFGSLYMIAQLANLGALILSIVGIINVVKGKETQLPLVGHLAVHVPL